MIHEVDVASRPKILCGGLSTGECETAPRGHVGVFIDVGVGKEFALGWDFESSRYGGSGMLAVPPD